MKMLCTGPMQFDKENTEKFAALGYEVINLPYSPGKSYDDMDFSEIDAVVCIDFFSYNDISRFPKLSYIHAESSGINHFPLDYIRSHGIHLCNARGVYSIPIAEYVLGGVLQLYKGFGSFRDNQREHRWKKVFNSRELAGRRVCIVGAGSIGTEIALRFGAMGCTVTGVRRESAEAPGFDCTVALSRLDSVLEESDIVILSLPLNEESRRLFDARRFEKIKPGAVFVNIARGGIVDTDALTACLENGRLSGAVLDVFEAEPLPADHPLWDMENVIVTPHSSFAGENNHKRMFDLLYKDTVDYLKNRK